MALHHLLASVFLLWATTAAQAQTFAVHLGDLKLGTMTFQQDGDALRLQSSLDNTPLNLFNGTLDASSRPVRLQTGEIRRQLLAISDTTRKSREVSVILDEDVVTDVVVNPAAERTDLSVAETVPPGVRDPVSAFGQLLSSQGCPPVMQMYDGRRVVRLATTDSLQTTTGRQCEMSYRVVAGPGHLSPLSFKSAAVSLEYDSRGLSTLRIAAGPFAVQIVRAN